MTRRTPTNLIVGSKHATLVVVIVHSRAAHGIAAGNTSSFALRRRTRPPLLPPSATQAPVPDSAASPARPRPLPVTTNHGYPSCPNLSPAIRK